MASPAQGSGISNGPNSRPLNDTLAQTGPGIPDDAASPDYDPVADAQAEHDAQARGTRHEEPPTAETLFNGP